MTAHFRSALMSRQIGAFPALRFGPYAEAADHLPEVRHSYSTTERCRRERGIEHLVRYFSSYWQPVSSELLEAGCTASLRMTST